MSARELIVVDGFNVLHAGVLRGRDRAGWRRPEARAKLLDALAPVAGGPAEVRVVFDARGDDRDRGDRRRRPTSNDARGAGGSGGDRRRARASGDADQGAAGGSAAGGIAVILAPHADDRIVEEVRREASRRPVTAVTSDRELARRAREAGARVVGAGAFLAGLARPD